ncbi:hypothetical protein AB1Y20_015909 [Prymnesium parvum]|uniref:Uncharacterized protein n=1 Tax=Prymnesium parvum TaxID=97485 RepID=A0AB34K1W4_PRYPA
MRQFHSLLAPTEAILKNCSPPLAPPPTARPHALPRPSTMMATTNSHSALPRDASTPGMRNLDNMSKLIAAEALTSMLRDNSSERLSTSASPELIRISQPQRPPKRPASATADGQIARRGLVFPSGGLSSEPAFDAKRLKSDKAWLKQWRPSFELGSTSPAHSDGTADNTTTPPSPTDIMHVPDPSSPSSCSERPRALFKAFLPSLALP